MSKIHTDVYSEHNMQFYYLKCILTTFRYGITIIGKIVSIDTALPLLENMQHLRLPKNYSLV
jgi:hypothetical protein